MQAPMVMPRALADDVMILAVGADMQQKYARALNHNHIYLQAMGARVAPAKSFNFGSCAKAKDWFADTW